MDLLDKFGFLKVNQIVEFDIYRIQPMPKYEEQLSIIKKLSHKDGFYYPPIHKSYRRNFKSGKINRNALPNTARPVLIHRVAPTHQVLCSKELKSEQFRKGDGHFILSFLGFLYSTRLQFWNWWWENRINTEQKPIIVFRDNQLSSILSDGLATWQSLTPPQQRKYLNALFLFQRGKVMEWYYEKFIHYYISLDTIWKLISSSLNSPGTTPGHKQRIILICQYLNICLTEDAIDLIYNTRNELFHEGLFGVLDGLDPLTTYSSERFHATLHLEQLIERMLIAILGFRPVFLSTPWWYIRGWQNWD